MWARPGMSEECTDALGNLFGQNMLEAASAGFDQLITYLQHVDEKPFGQPVASDDRRRVTEPLLRQFDMPVELCDMARIDRAVDHLGRKYMIAVLDAEEVLGGDRFPPLPFHVQDRGDLIEWVVCVISALRHEYYLPSLTVTKRRALST